MHNRAANTFRIRSNAASWRSAEITRAVFAAATAAWMLAPAVSAAADFMDISSVTAGPSGSFSGTIGGVSVTGTASSATFGFTAVANPATFDGSTTDGSSPQYSWSTFAPTQSTGDQIGWIQSGGPLSITITFGSPMTDVVFHVANRDLATLDFGPQQARLDGNPSLVGSPVNSTLSGLEVSGGANAAWPPTSDPSGATSGYASISLPGTFDTLSFQFTGAPTPDGGSFQISAAPADATACGGTPITGTDLADYIQDTLICAYKPANTNGTNANDRWSSIQDGTGLSGTLYEYARGANHPSDPTSEAGTWALVDDNNATVSAADDATRVQYNYGSYTYHWQVRQTTGGTPETHEFCDPADGNKRIAYAKDAVTGVTPGSTTGNACSWPNF